MSDLLTAAVKYATLGWGVIRLHHVLDDGSCSCRKPDCSSIGKHPLDPKGASLPEHDAEHVRHLWEQTPDANIGIVAGTSSLLILDFDTEEAIDRFMRLADHDTVELLARSPSVKTGRGIHIYLEDPTGGYSPSVGTNGDEGIDIRAGVSYVVAPPSNHANGSVYTWRRYPTNPPEPPTAWLDEYIRKRYDKPVRVYEDGDKITLHSRNKELTSLAGTMRRRGLTENAIRAALLEENTLRCDPPLEASEVISIAKSVSKYAPGDVPRDNERHDLATIVEELLQQDAEAKYTFLNVDQINALPDIEYLVDKLLPINGYGLVYGRRGSGKTFEMLHLALCIATGRDYRGMKVQQAGVAYIMSEGSAGLRKRLTAWSKAHDNADLSNFYALLQSVQLNDPELRAHLDIAIDKIPANVKLLIIDTLARSVSGLDENSSADMTRFIGYIDEIRHRRGIAVIPVHHAGWNEGHERGSTVIGDAADWICKVYRDEDDIIVKTEKVKDDELPKPIRLTLTPIEGTGSAVLIENLDEVEGDDLIDAIVKHIQKHKERSQKQLVEDLARDGHASSGSTYTRRWKQHAHAFRKRGIERIDKDDGTCLWRVIPDPISQVVTYESDAETTPFYDDERAA